MIQKQVGLLPVHIFTEKIFLYILQPQLKISLIRIIENAR